MALELLDTIIMLFGLFIIPVTIYDYVTLLKTITLHKESLFHSINKESFLKIIVGLLYFFFGLFLLLEFIHSDYAFGLMVLIVIFDKACTLMLKFRSSNTLNPKQTKESM